jgi:hypothetical protein
MALSIPVNPMPDPLPQGVKSGVITKNLDLTSAAASFTIGDRPAYSVIVSLEVELASTLTAATAVKFGVGTASDPDAYYLSAGLTTASNKTKFMLDTDTNVTAAETLKLSACATDGSAAGTVGGGADDTAKVRITYLYVEGF